MGTSLLTLTNQDFEVALFGAGDLFCIREFVLCVKANFDALGEFYLVFGAEQSSFADAVEINANQIGGRIVIGLITTRTAINFLLFCE